jgi:hypothetical protein
MVWLFENKGQNPPYPIVQHSTLSSSKPSFPQGRGNITMQAKSGHESTQGSVPWPNGATEKLGRNASSASASASNKDAISLF